MELRSLARSMLIAVTATAVSLWLVFRYTWTRESLAVLERFDRTFLLLAAGLMVLSWCTDGMRITLMTRAAGYSLRFRHGVRTVLLGHFLAGITPFLAGGAPLQVYSLYRAGVPSGTATALVLTGGIIAQTLLTVLSVVITVFLAPSFGAHGELLVTIRWVLLAYAIGLGAFFLLVWHVHSGTRPLVDSVVRFLHGRRWLDAAKIDRTAGSVLEFLSELNRSFRELVARRPYVALAGAVGHLVTFWVFFSVAPVLLRGVGIEVPCLLQLALQVPVYLLVSIIPTPGGSGGMETAMALAFASPLPEEALGPFVLGWRILTYYSQVFVGGLVLLFTVRKPLRLPRPSSLAPAGAPLPSSSAEAAALADQTDGGLESPAIGPTLQENRD